VAAPSSIGATSSAPAQPSTTDRRRPVAVDAWIIGFAVFAVYIATAKFSDPLDTDTRAASVAAWQLAMHGNATLTAVASKASWVYHVGNRDVTNRFPGVIFWGAPFYLLFGSRGAPTIYPGALAASASSAIAVALAFVLLTSLLSRRQAFIGALLFALATGTWTVSSNQLWTHGPAQLAVLLTLLLIRRDRWLLAGLPAGFAIVLRPHLGVVAAVLGLIEAVRTRRLRPLLISAGCLAGLAILIVYNHDVWGRYSIFGSYTSLDDVPSHRLSGFLFGIAGSLVSPERGMLVMTPALIPLLPGLRKGWSAAPWWVRSGALAGLAYLGVQLWMSRFSGGSGFYSYRVTLEGLSLCVPLLALAFREWTSETRARRTVFAVLATVSVALHAFGAVIDWTPSGQQAPWTTFLPINLARHVGLVPTSGAIVGAILLAAAAGRLSWQRQPAPTPT
jgi:hypothetical protein